jgi:hypothetical protein
MKKEPRPVIVEVVPEVHAIFVRYADRKVGQRHLAAGFDARDHTVETVTAWVEANPKIRLIAENN